MDEQRLATSLVNGTSIIFSSALPVHLNAEPGSDYALAHAAELHTGFISIQKRHVSLAWIEFYQDRRVEKPVFCPRSEYFVAELKLTHESCRFRLDTCFSRSRR